MTPAESWLLVLLVVVPSALTVGGLVWWGWDSWRKHEQYLQNLRDKWRNN